jgi:hypothetical protein
VACHKREAPSSHPFPSFLCAAVFDGVDGLLYFLSEMVVGMMFMLVIA